MADPCAISMTSTSGSRGPDTAKEFETYMKKFAVHDKHDRWQEGMHLLEFALKLCSRESFVARQQCQQRVYYEMGRVYARLGRYPDAIRSLNCALEADPRTSPVMLAKIHGELGITYRHQNDSQNAQESFGSQYVLAYEMSVEAEAEMCNSIGNEGMSAFSRYLLDKDQPAQQGETEEDKARRTGALLDDATEQIEARVRLALRLWERLDSDEKSQMMLQRYSQKPQKFRAFVKQYKEKCETWQVEGNDRLSLCHIAKAELAKSPVDAERCREQALAVVETSQKIQNEREKRSGEEDITVRAMSRYFHGNALWTHGRKTEAHKIWNPGEGKRGPAHALCKQPAAEYVEYVRKMALAGIDFEQRDEQDFTPLDYVYINMSDNPDARRMKDIIIEESLRPKFTEYYTKAPTSRRGGERSQAQIETDVEGDIADICNQSELRRCYRDVLDNFIRPALSKKTQRPLQEIRKRYEEALVSDVEKQQSLDWFWFLEYEDFKRANRLPHADFDKLAKRFEFAKHGARDLFIIFFSYRWIGGMSGRLDPDDADHSQYKRMLNALEAYLEDNSLDRKNVGIWLVSLASSIDSSFEISL